MPETVTHPTPEVLSAFGLGKLPAEAAATVASHLETCPECREVVEQLLPDSFLGRVRPAKPGATVLPQRPASASPPDPPSAVPVSPAVLPPELAHHPKYHIQRELGRGGMGVVYQARQTVMDRQVAIKVINQALLANPDALERFHREVQAAAKLSHPNIVTAYDAEQAGDLHLLVMEFVAGQSLAEVVHKKGPLPVAHACHYVRQAALGLQHAFEQGMVHRDIKPHNLMLTPKGQVKVLDFGLARLRGPARQGAGLTADGAFMGTPEYVSPEQATDARTADIRADLYSLGCTLCFLLTGRPPFLADTAVKLLLAHIEKDPPPLRELRPDVPEALSAVVGRLLAKDPAQRYQTPVELAQALVPFIKAGAQGAVVPVVSRPRSVASPARGTVVGTDTSQREKLDRAETGGGAELASDVAELFTSLAAPAKRAQAAKRTSDVRAGFRGRKRSVIGAAASLVLLGLVGLWAAGVFTTKVKTKAGILILDVNEPNTEVDIDGEKVAVSWDGGGKTAQVSVPPGTRKVQVKKDGFSADSRELTFKDGDRVIFTARLVPESRPPKNGVPSEQSPPWAEAKTPAIETSAQSGLDSGSRSRFPVSADVEQPVYGAWQVHGNELVQPHWVWGARLLFGRKTWTDYDFTVEAKMVDRSCGFGMLFRNSGGKLHKHPQDGTSRYKDFLMFLVGGFGNTHHYLEQVRDNKGGETLSIKRLGPTQRLQKGEWYTGRVSVRGNHIRCFVNNDQLFDVFAQPPPAGLVGLMTWDAPFHFRNIKVTDPRGKVLLEGLPDLQKSELPSAKEGPKAERKIANGVGPTPQRDRICWVHSRGSFTNQGGKDWEERIDRTSHKFTETSRTDEYVELRNKTAAVWVRLHENRCEVKFNNGPYRRYYRGRWKPTATEVSGTTSATASGDGFTPLFDGKDNVGWKTHASQPGNWRVQNGVLIGSSNGVSHLYTVRDDYMDFDLRLEARINYVNDGVFRSSGVYFRAPFGPNFPANKPTWLSAYNAKIDARRLGGLLIDRDPELHRTRELSLKPGEWVAFEVIAQGNHIIIKVNGETTADYTDGQRRYVKGHIALQQHGPATVLEFRKIEIKEFSPTPAPDPLRQEVDKASAAYSQALHRVDQRLLAAFDKEIDVLRKQNLNAEKRLLAIKDLTAEKEAFAQRGVMPWSPRMRWAAMDYLQRLEAAKKPLKQAYDSAIQHHIKSAQSDSLKVAGDLRAEKHSVLFPNVAGDWDLSNGPTHWHWTLFTDGTVNKRDGTQAWNLLRHGTFIFRVRNPAAPGGVWVNTCNVAKDGATFSASNQKGVRFTGKLVR